MLHIDKQYTPEELRLEYATKARKLFDEHQRWRGRCLLWDSLLLLTVMVLGVVAIKVPWCAVALSTVAFVLIVSRLSPKAVDHALAAMTYLRHARTFESMSDLDAIQSAIMAFEVDTLHY